MKQIPYRGQMTTRRKKSHHGKISDKQSFAIREIERVVKGVRFIGKTRYQASLFINFFIDENRTIYPEGRKSCIIEMSKEDFEFLKDASLTYFLEAPSETKKD